MRDTQGQVHKDIFLVEAIVTLRPVDDGILRCSPGTRDIFATGPDPRALRAFLILDDPQRLRREASPLRHP